MFSLFLPERCVHCEEPTAFARDRHNVEPFRHYLCNVCIRIVTHQQAPNEEDVHEKFGPLGKGVEYRHARAAFTFIADSPIQSIVHSFKYSGMARLGKICGQSISSLVPKEIEAIVPVPLHRTRMAERGYNQAEILAKAMSSPGRVVLAAKRTRPTPSQTNLSLTKRIENMQGAFDLTPDARKIERKNILIVDDVMTTGSTLASVAEALVSAKPKSISTLALAIAEHKP